MNYDQSIIDICVQYTSQQISKSNYIRERISSATIFLNVLQNVTCSTRIYCVKNDIAEIPKCKKCNENCMVNKKDAKLGFTTYCSSECSRSDKTINKTKETLLSNYDWLYNERILLKKSKETIAKELEISVVPVSKWIKHHDIAAVKYNCANAYAMSKISDKEWMIEQNKIQKKKCDDIAQELGISKSTVSIWLAKHDIESNPANSYDRKHITTSKECQEVIDYIRSIYSGEIKLNDRGILNGMELDILIPEKSLAIEYNGVYSHLYRPEEKTASAIKGGNYHLSKTEGCVAAGIQLIHIFSDSWKSKTNVWKSYLKNKLGCNSNKVFARKCEIRTVDIHTRTQFLNDNHIQGNGKSLYNFGLYYQNELLGVMTFGKSRYNRNYDYELIRFAVKNNYSIIGGFSKLLAYFKKHHNGSIISYADLTYSAGNVYAKNGFTLLIKNKPSYYYVLKNTEIRLHRSNFVKSKITTRNDNRTEEEIMKDMGYSKIFDCGTLTFVM